MVRKLLGHFVVKKLSVLLLLYSSYSLAFKASEKLILQVGEGIRIKSPPSHHTWLNKGGVISVSDQGQFLFIQARRVGEVLLKTGYKLYKIQVISPENKSHWVALKKLLSTKKGLEVDFAQEHLQVTGHLYRLKDFNDLSLLAQERNFSYLFSAKVPSSLQSQLRAYIQDQTKDIWITPFKILWQSPLKILIPKDAPLTDTQKNLLRRFGIQITEDSTLLHKSPLIELKVLLVESSLNSSIHTHFPWENSEGDNLVTRILDGDFFRTWLRRFKILEDEGQASVLSQAVLLNESGKSSRFVSGGEVPVPHYHVESGTQSFKWKPYGIQLQFDTRADRTQTIHLKVQAEISEINHAHSVRSAPSLKTNRVHSSVTLKSGQTLSLSSLIRRQKGKSLSAPLIITRTPLVGRFFSLKGKLIDRTRLTVFITARIL